ncbi:MAG: GMC family oxidoreductase [Polyangiaceae bacterium]|nr:GMC family oxidoreductase [Polyangiaceae bacterium]
MNDNHFDFDTIVVGSGFGGSVTAFRLAEANERVCLLERGKAYPPRSFARSPAEMRKNFWDPSEGLQGMFDVWSFRGTDALVSSGLGGGSLIYANVLLRKPERWFVRENLQKGGYESWPVSYRQLERHYEAAEKNLDGQAFPHDREPYAKIAKTRALAEAARGAGYEWFTPKLAVTFAANGRPPSPGEPILEDHPNLHGARRTTCQLCGECNVGCNYGSKNSLDYTYLSHAKRLGCEIRVRCEVRHITRRDRGGFDVEYVEHVDENEGRKTDTSQLPLKKISAKKVVLAAGTYGTTWLLLRNRKRLKDKISRALGKRVGGNGDFLSFAWKCHESKGGERVPRPVEPTRGPVITSTVHVPDRRDGGSGRGFYIQDAGIPAFLSWVAQPLGGFGVVGQAAQFAWRYASRLLGLERGADLDLALSELIGMSEATGSTLPFLGMGRDIPDGTLRIDGKWLELDYSEAGSRELFDAMQEVAQRLASELDATYVVNPLYRFKKLITVHPLGGCSMADDPEHGVVDADGQVFGCPGLYIADGSVMPGPVGPNPALTIAALADWFADGMLGLREPAGVR